MTKQELWDYSEKAGREINTLTINRDVKRLWRSYQDFINNNPYNREKRQELIDEYERLYYADDTFEYMNKKSVLIMVSLNRVLKAVEFHQFGNSIEFNI